MPKQKSHKGLLKRVKVTGKGKIKRKKAFTGHLMSSKSSNRKRHLKKSTIMTGNAVKVAKAMINK